MRLLTEEQILNKDFRANALKEIQGNENQKRKKEMKKRYDIYKDQTKKFVLENFNDESNDKKAVEEIINRTSNVSICRKIIEKKAMVYKEGVSREIVVKEKGKFKKVVSKIIGKDDVDENQEQLDKIVDITNFNSKMKKVNKYTELFKNGVVSILPYECPTEPGKFAYNMRVWQPYLYDVIEDQNNPEIGRVYIFSYFNPNQSTPRHAPEGQAGNREQNGSKTTARKWSHGDGVDQTIADAPNDFNTDHNEFVWWSNKYHLTTDEKGNVITDEKKTPKKFKNPIGMLPFFNFSQDQDGQFWALGGDDIIDASILINVLLTDLFYIAKFQGMGLGYFFGKGVPKNMRIGPSAFVTLEVEQDDPKPELGFASSNPPLESHLKMIETYLAFILSTNNLEPGTVQGTLSASNASSGIQEVVKKSENMDDIEDQREMYRDGEPVLFKIIAKWHNLYFGRKLLCEDLQDLGSIDESLKVKTKFADAQPFMTEDQKLEAIKKRKELGLDSEVDSIMKDNSDLTREEAEEKLRKIMEEKLVESSNKLKAFQANPIVKKEEEEIKDEE